MGLIGLNDLLKAKVLAPATGAVVGGAVGAAIGGVRGAQIGVGLGLAWAWKMYMVCKIDNSIDQFGNKVDRFQSDDTSQILSSTVEKAIDTCLSIIVAGSAIYLFLYTGANMSAYYKSKCLSMTDNVDCFFLSFQRPAATCVALIVLGKLGQLIYAVSSDVFKTRKIVA